MTEYLLDENVLREFRDGAHPNVHKWLATVNDSDLRLSTSTLFEKRRGAQMLARRDAKRAQTLLDAIAVVEKAYASRIIPIGPEIVAEWTRMLGVQNKDRWDLALAATARIHNLTIVTRNITDFSGRGVRLLNPFVDPPLIIEP